MKTSVFGGLLLTLSLLLSGCWLDENNLGGPQSVIAVNGPVARSQLEVFMVTIWVSLGIFIVVGGVLLWATLKFRARSEADEHAAPPPQGHGNPLVEISLIAASVFLLVIIAIPTLKVIWYQYDVPADEKAGAYEVTATGYQWWFRFDYKEGFTTGNEMVVPTGQAVRVNLRAADVIHSFWVPKLAGKVDMIPNRANHLWFKAEDPGYYYAQCAEYCGEMHAVMKFRVIALAPADWEKWLANQKGEARTVTAQTVAREAVSVPQTPQIQYASLLPFDRPALAPANFASWQAKQHPSGPEDAAQIARGRELFKAKTCAGCHTVRGHGYQGITGPELTHFGARTTLAAGYLDNNLENLKRWIAVPNEVKPGNKMYFGGYVDVATRKPLFTLNDEEVAALAAYLQSLK